MNDMQEELFRYCREFIETQGISCSEAIYQTDQVILNAYDFIHGICELIGYAPSYEDAE